MITTVLDYVKNPGSWLIMNQGYKLIRMKYGERLKAAREYSGLSQGGLAAKIKYACSQENISKLERGNATGSEFTPLFARACKVDVMWLTLGEGDMISRDIPLSDTALALAEEFEKLSPSSQEKILELLQSFKNIEEATRFLSEQVFTAAIKSK